jgi:FAD/FMN-containing dehydrogenase
MWSNWAGDQRCQPAAVERPAAVGEVVGAVERAVAAGRGVRVAGSGHSFTAAVLTDGTLLSLDRMGAVLDADPSSGLVRVEAGIRLHALSQALAERGLAMPNLGDIDEQSLAGAISTATHGTGVTLRNVSAQVRALRLVTARGTVVDVDGGEELLAARVALGALGVVTEVTLHKLPARFPDDTQRDRGAARAPATADSLPLGDAVCAAPQAHAEHRNATSEPLPPPAHPAPPPPTPRRRPPRRAPPARA